MQRAWTVVGGSGTWTSDSRFSGAMGTRSQMTGTSDLLVPATVVPVHRPCGAGVGKSWVCDACVRTLGDPGCGGLWVECPWFRGLWFWYLLAAGCG